VTASERAELKRMVSAARLARERLFDDEALGERECGYCGGSFMPSRWDQRYCSARHRKYAGRARAAA